MPDYPVKATGHHEENGRPCRMVCHAMVRWKAGEKMYTDDGSDACKICDSAAEGLKEQFYNKETTSQFAEFFGQRVGHLGKEFKGHVIALWEYTDTTKWRATLVDTKGAVRDAYKASRAIKRAIEGLQNQPQTTAASSGPSNEASTASVSTHHSRRDAMEESGAQSSTSAAAAQRYQFEEEDDDGEDGGVALNYEEVGGVWSDDEEGGGVPLNYDEGGGVWLDEEEDGGAALDDYYSEE